MGLHLHSMAAMIAAVLGAAVAEGQEDAARARAGARYVRLVEDGEVVRLEACAQ